tara:strand:- start:47 stop:565 length:519 start_codon:yes stop_codon:yes gene_type:complete
MIEDYDEVNHFIHNKIEKYNEKFAEFKRNLDVQDHKIKKECRKKIGKEIKKNPKKMAQKFIDLARNNDDTTEETEYSENETKKIFKHSLKGGMVDDDYSDNIQIDEIAEEENIIDNTYLPIYIGIVLSIFLYIFTFSILYSVGATEYYNIIMFKPFLIIIDLYESLVPNQVI